MTPHVADPTRQRPHVQSTLNKGVLGGCRTSTVFEPKSRTPYRICTHRGQSDAARTDATCGPQRSTWRSLVVVCRLARGYDPVSMRHRHRGALRRATANDQAPNANRVAHHRPQADRMITYHEAE